MGLVLAAAATAGVYAVVATTAPTMAASISGSETTNHALMTEFDTTSKHNAAVRDAIRAKCALLVARQGDSRQKTLRLRKACERAE
jgi:hypothetical protein